MTDKAWRKDSLKNDEETLGQDLMTTMGCLSKRTTHLPMTIWIEVKRSIDDCRIPQLRFANNTSDSLQFEDPLPVSISPTPQLLASDAELKISELDYETLKQWIIANHEALLKYWHAEIDTYDLLKFLKSHKA